MVEIHELYQELKSSNYLVDIDSRKIRNGSIFFGIKGDNFNGNDFVIDALKNGSRLAVTDDENPALSNNPNIIRNLIPFEIFLEEIRVIKRSRK